MRAATLRRNGGEDQFVIETCVHLRISGSYLRLGGLNAGSQEVAFRHAVTGPLCHWRLVLVRLVEN